MIKLKQDVIYFLEKQEFVIVSTLDAQARVRQFARFWRQKESFSTRSVHRTPDFRGTTFCLSKTTFRR